MSTGGNSLAVFGRGIRRRLRRIYGSPEAAERAVREQMEDAESVELWASVVTAESERLAMDRGEYLEVSRGGEPFRLDDLPAGMRENALACLAAAMLVWTDERAREAS